MEEEIYMEYRPEQTQTYHEQSLETGQDEIFHETNNRVQHHVSNWAPSGQVNPKSKTSENKNQPWIALVVA